MSDRGKYSGGTKYLFPDILQYSFMKEIDFLMYLSLFQTVNIRSIESKHQNHAHTDKASRKQN